MMVGRHAGRLVAGPAPPTPWRWPFATPISPPPAMTGDGAAETGMARAVRQALAREAGR